MGSTAIVNGNVVRKQSLRPNKRPLMSRWNFLIFFLIQILIKSRIWEKSGNGVPFQNAKEMEASQVRRWPWRWWTRRQTEEFISMLIGRTPTEAEKCAALPLRGATFERKWSQRNAETGGAWRETHKKKISGSSLSCFIITANKALDWRWPSPILNCVTDYYWPRPRPLAAFSPF